MTVTYSNRQIEVAIVGLGRIGARLDLLAVTQKATHASACTSDTRFQLIAGVETFGQSRTDFESNYGLPTFSTIEELMEKARPEVVVIATPTSNHLSDLKALLSYPQIKLIVCEKPISLETVELGDLLIQAANRNIKVLVNYQRRTESSANYLRRVILDNELGKFLCGTGFYSRGYFNNASHMLDLLEWWFNSQSTLLSLGKSYKSATDYEASMFLSIADAVFSLQAVPVENVSVFEVYLQFELGQIRYSTGGDKIYIDRYASGGSSSWLLQMNLSQEPIMMEKVHNMESVYNDIYNHFMNLPAQLPTGTAAASLVRRMTAFLGGI